MTLYNAHILNIFYLLWGGSRILDNLNEGCVAVNVAVEVTVCVCACACVCVRVCVFASVRGVLGESGGSNSEIKMHSFC